MLVLVAIGLIGYVIWRFVQAIKDPENKGNDAKGLAVRIAYAVNGLIYASLALSAVQIVMGTGSGKNSRRATRFGEIGEKGAIAKNLI